MHAPPSAMKTCRSPAESYFRAGQVRGLACLGYHHNRWHVRDVVVAILQGIRSDEDAGAAIEGLRMAGKDAAEWTVGDTIIRTLRPTLRGGVVNFFEYGEE
jgi:hypothetical protein